MSGSFGSARASASAAPSTRHLVDNDGGRCGGGGKGGGGGGNGGGGMRWWNGGGMGGGNGEAGVVDGASGGGGGNGWFGGKGCDSEPRLFVAASYEVDEGSAVEISVMLGSRARERRENPSCLEQRACPPRAKTRGVGAARLRSRKLKRASPSGPQRPPFEHDQTSKLTFGRGPSGLLARARQSVQPSRRLPPACE